jgi:hypothetical protein
MSGEEKTTLARSYEQRRADAGPLRIDIWTAVKDARDEAFNPQCYTSRSSLGGRALG